MPKRGIPKFEFVSDDMAAVLREKTGAERLEIAFGMIRSARTMLENSLRSQHRIGARKRLSWKLRKGSPRVETSELLRYAVDALDRLGIRNFVTGSFAAIYYGEPRFTNEVDAVIGLPFGQIRDLCTAFPASDFHAGNNSA